MCVCISYHTSPADSAAPVAAASENALVTPENPPSTNTHASNDTRHQSNTQIYILICSGKFVLHTKTHTHIHKRRFVDTSFIRFTHFPKYCC